MCAGQPAQLPPLSHGGAQSRRSARSDAFEGGAWSGGARSGGARSGGARGGAFEGEEEKKNSSSSRGYGDGTPPPPPLDLSQANGGGGGGGRSTASSSVPPRQSLWTDASNSFFGGGGGSGGGPGAHGALLPMQRVAAAGERSNTGLQLTRAEKKNFAIDIWGIKDDARQRGVPRAQRTAAVVNLAHDLARLGFDGATEERIRFWGTQLRAGKKMPDAPGLKSMLRADDRERLHAALQNRHKNSDTANVLQGEAMVLHAMEQRSLEEGRSGIVDPSEGSIRNYNRELLLTHFTTMRGQMATFARNRAFSSPFDAIQTAALYFALVYSCWHPDVPRGVSFCMDNPVFPELRLNMDKCTIVYAIRDGRLVTLLVPIGSRSPIKSTDNTKSLPQRIAILCVMGSDGSASLVLIEKLRECDLRRRQAAADDDEGMGDDLLRTIDEDEDADGGGGGGNDDDDEEEEEEEEEEAIDLTGEGSMFNLRGSHGTLEPNAAAAADDDDDDAADDEDGMLFTIDAVDGNPPSNTDEIIEIMLPSVTPQQKSMKTRWWGVPPGVSDEAVFWKFVIDIVLPLIELARRARGFGGGVVPPELRAFLTSDGEFAQPVLGF